MSTIWVRNEYDTSTIRVRYEYDMSTIRVRYEYDMSTIWVRYEYARFEITRGMPGMPGPAGMLHTKKDFVPNISIHSTMHTNLKSQILLICWEQWVQWCPAHLEASPRHRCHGSISWWAGQTCYCDLSDLPMSSHPHGIGHIGQWPLLPYLHRSLLFHAQQLSGEIG